MKFIDDDLKVEDSFWVMYYFSEKYYDISEETFNVEDILSASTPFNWNGMYDDLMPADRSMIEYWNEAVMKFKSEVKPSELKLRK